MPANLFDNNENFINIQKEFHLKLDNNSIRLSLLLDSIVEYIETVQPMFSYILNSYLTFFCVTSGILLNILCIYIFLKYRNGSPVIQYYLVTLTLWQTALLCNAFFLYCLPTLVYGSIIARGYYVLIYPYAYALANTTLTGTIWIIMTLTIDRYLALCQPLKHRAIGKRSRVKRLMIAVSILAVIFSIPRFFEVATVYDCDNNQCIPVVARTSIIENKTYWTIYHIVLQMLFVSLVPCLLLFGLTLRISIALRQAVVKRKALCAPTNELDSRNKKSQCSKKEHRANVMLILVIAKFLISDILPALNDVLEHIVGPDVFTRSSTATLVVDISNFMVVLNCSTNFWIFLFWGKRFRKSCIKMFYESRLGKKLYSKINDSDIISYFNQPSSFTTNYTKSKNLIYSDNKTLTPKKSFVPVESTILLLSTENGYLQEPLITTNKKISQQHLLPNQNINKNKKYTKTLSTESGRNSLEFEKQVMLNILASERK